MQFKSKIKSITIQSTRGTRILPTQILLSDSNKSVSISQLPNISFNKQSSRQLSNQIALPDSSRVNNRHTTEVVNYRPLVSRLSLKDIQNKSINRDSNGQGNLSDRNMNVSSQQQINERATNSNNERTETIDKLQRYRFNAFKDIQIQSIVSAERKCQDISPTRFEPSQLQSQMGSLFKNSQTSTMQTNTKLQQALSSEYKNKYDLLEKDYKDIIQKFKNYEQMVERLQQEKHFNKNLSYQQSCKIQGLEQKLIKLEQALKTNRNINEVLMKNQRQFQKKLKRIQQQHESVKLDIIQAQKQKRQGIIITMQKQVFQLKLKTIDQQNRYEQANKLKQIQNKYHLSQLQQSLHHYYNENLETKDRQLSQIYLQNNNLRMQLTRNNNEMMQMREQISRIDQQNVRLDQFNFKLVHQNQAIALQNIRMMQENSKLVQHVQLITHQNAKQLQIFNDKLTQITNQYSISQNERESLIDNLQDKESLIGQLNLAKNHGLLQILELKNQLKLQISNKQQLELTIKNEKNNKQQMQTEFNQLKRSLQQKLQLRDKEINAIHDDIQSFKVEKLRNNEQRNKQIELINCQYFTFKSRLEQQLQQIKQANINKEIEISQIVEQKQQLLQRISKYQQKQLQRDQMMIKRQSQVSERANQLKEVQQQYLDLIEGELKKIQFFNDQQDQVEFKDISPYSCINRSVSSSSYQSPNKQSRIASNKSSSGKHQQQQMLDLMMKVQQLTFVNEALKKKVEELTQLQEHSNIIIIEKIKQFQFNLERSLQEKFEADQQNIILAQRIKQMSELTINYENRIQWLNNIYKQLQMILMETQQQLFRSQLQFINHKLTSNQDSIEYQVGQQIIVAANNNSQEIERQMSSSQCQEIIEIINKQIQQESQDEQQKLKLIEDQQEILSNQDQQQQIQTNIIQKQQIQDDYKFEGEDQYQSFIPQINVILIDSQQSEEYIQYPYINIIEVSSEEEGIETEKIQNDSSFQLEQQIVMDEAIIEPITMQKDSQSKNFGLQQQQYNIFAAFIQNICQQAQQLQEQQRQQQKKLEFCQQQKLVESCENVSNPLEEVQ